MEKLYSYTTLSEERQKEILEKIRTANTSYADLEDLARNYSLPQHIANELNQALKAQRHESRTKKAGDKLWNSTNRY